MALGESGRIEDDGVELLARIRPVAQNLKGVAFHPFHLRGEAGAVGLEVSLRHFERGAGGVNARNLSANLRQMQRKAALVAADVESTSAPVAIRQAQLRAHSAAAA